MRRWVGGMLLAVASGHAGAEWQSLGDTGNAELFVDRATLVRSGETVKLWTVYALKTPGSANGVAYVSLKRQDEFDCAGSRMRGVQISAHAEPLGEGKVVASEKGSGAWQAVAPQSTGEKLWKLACGKE